MRSAVQNVEVDGGAKRNETQWREELEAIEKMIEEAKRRHNESLNVRPQALNVMEEVQHSERQHNIQREGAVRMDEELSGKKQIIGGAALLGCAVFSEVVNIAAGKSDVDHV